MFLKVTNKIYNFIIPLKFIKIYIRILKISVIIYNMENDYKIYSIFNPRDKLIERKEELIKEHEMVRKQCREKYKEQTKEILRQMQICLTKN